MIRQCTLKNVIRASGVGLHSGRKVYLSLRPAPANTGIIFRRVDLDDVVEIKACPENVGDTTLSTTLSRGQVCVSTVEHLLSAMAGLGIDNAYVDVSAPEVPIMDGSAQPCVDMIQGAGIRDLAAPRKFIKITREVSVSQGDAHASLRPYDGFRAAYTFVADHPVFNRYPKRVDVDFASACYVGEVSAARSFGLMRELTQAQAIRKCLGSSLQTAVGTPVEDIVTT